MPDQFYSKKWALLRGQSVLHAPDFRPCTLFLFGQVHPFPHLQLGDITWCWYRGIAKIPHSRANIRKGRFIEFDSAKISFHLRVRLTFVGYKQTNHFFGCKIRNGFSSSSTNLIWVQVGSILKSDNGSIANTQLKPGSWYEMISIFILDVNDDEKYQYEIWKQKLWWMFSWRLD